MNDINRDRLVCAAGVKVGAIAALKSLGASDGQALVLTHVLITDLHDKELDEIIASAMKMTIVDDDK